MTSENAYFRQLARLRQALEQGNELPDYLMPEAQKVTDDIRARALEARDAVLRGDVEALRERSAGLAAAGFDRDAEKSEEDVPELNAAREELRGEGSTDEDDEQAENGRSGHSQ